MKEKIFAVIGFADVRVPIEDEDKPVSPDINERFLVGYELEDGRECDEEGNLIE